MGDARSKLTESEAAHLLRRTGFGADPKEVRKLAGKRTRGAAADRLLKFRPKPIKFKFPEEDRDFRIAQDQWLQFMLTTKHPLQEKLVLFWHDHFATAIDKVQDPDLMIAQNQLLRLQCKGNFKILVKAINRDPAMMEFLDTVRNRRRVPNENYARELMELFTLGVTDLAGNPTYTQADIVQIARAFTGWRYERPEQEGRRDPGVRAVFDEGRHDFMASFPERGPKVVFQSTGGFGPAGRSLAAAGEGPVEIDTVIDVLFEHRDSAGQRTVARRIAHRLLEYFAHAEPETAVVDEVVAASGFAASWDIAALLRAIFVHDAFYASGAPAPFGALAPKSITWPVAYVVATVRLLKLRLQIDEERGLRVEGGSRSRLRSHLDEMGQTLFDPPSVFGWNWESGWITSSTLLARYGFARDITAARGDEKSAFHPEKVLGRKLTAPAAIVDAVLRQLGIGDQMTTDERAVLIDYLDDGGALAAIDVLSEHGNGKVRGLFALVLQSPAYQMQ